MLERVKHKLGRGVRLIEGEFKLTLDGQHFLSVPPRLMRLIRKAEKVQGKINAEAEANPLFELKMSELADAVAGINCHKAVVYAREEISENVLTSKEEDPNNKGYAQLIRLASEFQKEHHILLTVEDVREFALLHSDQFPFSVHIFRSVRTLKGSGWFPTHSFLWLGIDEADNEICYQKRGPDVVHPFELVTLDEATEGYEEIPSFYIVVPIPDTQTSEEQES